MRKTKIICTIGPASENEEILTRMCRSGMNVARLNFSHGTHEEHKKKFDLVKQVREKLDLPIAIMLDTKGPEYRIGTFENGKITLKDGDEFIFTTEDIVGDQTRVSVSYKRLIEDLNIGDRILLNNGLVIFEVTKVSGPEAICKVITGGVLSNRKSMNFPNKTLKQEYLSEIDKSDLLFGIKNLVIVPNRSNKFLISISIPLDTIFFTIIIRLLRFSFNPFSRIVQFTPFSSNHFFV